MIQGRNPSHVSKSLVYFYVGYYTALERTMFYKHVDEASLKYWETNVSVHERGLELIKPGVK